MISIASNSSIVLKYGTAYINAPAYSDEKDAEAVYIPDDAGMKYYDMQKLLNYVPRYRTVLKSEELSTVDENNLEALLCNQQAGSYDLYGHVERAIGSNQS